MKLSEKILTLRKRESLSQEELAAQLGVSRQAISRWEQGTAQPEANNIFQLSRLFGVSADVLLDESRDLETEKSAPANERTQTVAGAVLSAIGAIGNLILYILSRFFEVMVPANHGQWIGDIWTSNTYTKDRDYWYFIQEYELETLAAALWIMLAAGIFLLLRTERGKTLCSSFRRSKP